jgi:TetR/AcrR family transcriptional repressor of nem operon
MARGPDTKQRITQAAKTLFSVHGCEGTTIDDIITASGITKGAFYHYFKSKDDLSKTIIDQLVAEYGHVVDSLPADAQPLERLRLLLGRLAELNTSGEWVNCRLILRLSTEFQQGQPQLQQRLLRFWQWYLGFLEDLILQCRAAGQIKTNISPKIQTHLLLNLLAGTVILEKTNPDAPPLGDMIEAVVHTLTS